MTRATFAALGALGLLGCQSLGAFSQPDTLPRGAVRIGASVDYDRFRVSDERVNAGDVALTAQAGVADGTELDGLVSASTLEAQVKQRLVATPHVLLSVEGGLGLFTAYNAGTSAAYVPVQLVAGLRAADDIVLFAGPAARGELGLDPPTHGAGFLRGDLGLLGGGVAGVALESPRFTFVPQVDVLTPLGTGAGGTAVQVSFGFATDVHHAN